MKWKQLKPALDWHTNAALKGQAGIPDLPVTKFHANGEHMVGSSYRVRFWDRVRFLFCGRIEVSLVGKTHAPMAVGIGAFFVRKAKD